MAGPMSRPLFRYVRRLGPCGVDILVLMSCVHMQALSLFLTGFLREHGKLLEGRPDMHAVLLEAHEYVVMLSDVDETEIFKVWA